MRVALFDPWSGVSGNMILGALLDAGLEEGSLVEVLEGLPLEGWTMKASRVTRAGISGTLVDISVEGEQPPRRLADVLGILEDAPLPGDVRERCTRAFRRLAEAEAAVHGTDPGEVHFHEVGAVDAILDVVGSFAGMHLLGVEKVFSRPVATGFGTTECAHGTLPVPSPATLSLLKGVPVLPWRSGAEMATPTGVAVLTTAVADWNESPPVIRVEGTGMGAGSRDGELPNLLRLTLGEVLDPGAGRGRDVCSVLTCLVDDLDPRIWPVLFGKLLEEGAVDCYTRHCTGRKGRPALELVVMCPVDRTDTVSDVVLAHTSTLGVRMEAVSRRVLPRRFREVETRWGRVRVKLGELDGKTVSAEPEFEDCVSIAGKAGVPVKLVLQEARGRAADLVEGES